MKKHYSKKLRAQNFHLVLFHLLLLSACCNGLPNYEKKKQRVCVIGAGATGLASAKQLADYIDEFDIVVYEQKSDVGGLWIYNENIDEDEHGLPIQSSIYKNLRTNIPKELMTYPDYRYFHGEERSCVTHEIVLQYLKNYTDLFNLHQYIRFNTIVERITPILNNVDLQIMPWKIQIRDLISNMTEETICDAVMVCNGHNSKPLIPTIPGIKTFPGKVIHSHIYRNIEDFADKIIVLLGASASGIDISLEISELAKKVYLSHNKEKISQLPSKIIQVPGVISANGSELILKDGSKIIADEFILCTGYDYDYPFLDESSQIFVNDKHVRPLYKHLINIQYPTMAFIGIPFNVLVYPTSYMQARYFISFLQGKFQLPDKEEMMKDVEVHNRPERYAHNLGSEQWDYHDELARQAGFQPLPAFYEKGFKIWNEHRTKNILNYKESNLLIIDDRDVIIVPSNISFESVKHVRSDICC